MGPKLWYIRGIPLFAGSDDLAAQLRRVGRVERWGHRAQVTLREDPQEIQVVIAGQLDLQDGRYHAVVKLAPGDLFGRLDEPEATLQLRAYDDLVIASLPRADFESVTENRLGELSATLGVMRRRALRVPVAPLLYTPPERRIASVILHLADASGALEGDTCRIDLPVTPRQIARLSGLADPTVSDIVDSYKRDRIVEVGRTQLVIPSMERIRQLTHG